MENRWMASVKARCYDEGRIDIRQSGNGFCYGRAG